jgi:hypothetical protein
MEAEKMATATLAIQVSEEAARAFMQLSPEDQRKIQLLLDLRLRDLRSCEYFDFASLWTQSVGCVKRTAHYRSWCVSRTLQKFTTSDRFAYCRENLFRPSWTRSAKMPPRAGLHRPVWSRC